MTSNKDISVGEVNYPDLVDGVHISDTPLSKSQAEDLTRSIRDAAEVIWVLIARAHAGKAWKALGYDSWAEYVQEEFNMSRSRSYQLLDQAKVISAVTNALPEGSEIAVTESSARELKYVIQEAVPEIREKTKGLEPEEAVKVTQEILARYKKEQEEAEQKSSEKVEEPASVEPVDQNLSSEDINSQAEDLSTGASPAIDEESTDALDSEVVETVEPPVPATPPPPAIDPEELARIRKNVNAAHDIYSALAALASLPDNLDEVINIIPTERGMIINKNLPTAIDNLSTFRDKWLAANKEDEAESN